MKSRIILTAIFICIANVLFAQTTLSIDTKNSIINWTGHAEVGSYAPKGTLNVKEGVVKFNRRLITGGTLTVDMKSMSQENENLLAHLKSDDFFDVEKYPVSVLKIERISKNIAYGKLTMKNKTLPFECPITIKQEKDRFTITGSALIDRTQYGIIYNSGNFFSGLGDKAIRNTFEIEFRIITSGF